ncbi:energy-coupling factor transporter transmembrane component T [Streptococcus iners]|uniref:Energy-coupling factor transporter transmembrane component T n=1 Tax=Streptococcus iners subsp. hyiners TaxID=3028083 RepID=A0AA96VIW8_9STRE|nr:energy-coupling factor transporter transmembrane component T [Streptococcus sp. 29892]MCK4030029.1 energy-coupling factor transporter transmembrane protein EcfT [Streptococcus suis]WNY49329.1 energy-coupling factor transporter transmembrane component T [Streptococcus sp. 29892]
MKLDARTKIILVIFASITYGLRLTILENAVLVLGSSLLFWFSQKKKMAVIGVLFYTGFWLLSYISFLPAWLAHVLVVLTYTWPPLLAGHFLLMTTSSYELVHGLRKWRLPEAFLLTLGVMFRFLPAIKEDARTIRASLQVRGIFLRKRDVICRPLQYLECFLVPLMMSLLRTAQELTVASLTKGLALSGKPTEYLQSSWSLLDWSICLCCVSFLLLVQL